MVREYRMMTDAGETRICYRAINVKSVKSNCLNGPNVQPH